MMFLNQHLLGIEMHVTIKLKNQSAVVTTFLFHLYKLCKSLTNTSAI